MNFDELMAVSPFPRGGDSRDVGNHGSPRRGTGFASHTKTLKIVGFCDFQLHPPHIGGGLGGGGCLLVRSLRQRMNKINYAGEPCEKKGIKGGCPLGLILRHVRNHLAIHRINPLAGDIAKKSGIRIHDWEPVCPSTIKRPHDIRHGGGFRKGGFGFDHQLTGSKMMIKLRPEHDIPDLHDLHLTEEHA